MTRRQSAVSMAVMLMVAAGTASAQLDKILKGGGVAFVVTKFGPQINRFLNGLTHTSNNDPQFATKVVPVLSVGTGGYAGAVQVAGPRAEVDKVQAVAQVEGNFSGIDVRVRGLIPIATKSVSNIRRVPGVGVSGLLDIKL